MIRREITIYLVEGDTGPDLPIRFTDLDLANYDSITMNVKREDCSRFSKIVTPVGVSDSELGHVTWSATDLVTGRHEAEFVLILTAGTQTITLPRKHTVILDVRRDLG